MFTSALANARRRPLRFGLLILEVALGVAAVFLVLNAYLGNKAEAAAAKERGRSYLTAFPGRIEVQKDAKGRAEGMSLQPNWAFSMEDVAALRRPSAFIRAVSPIEQGMGGTVRVGDMRYMIPGALSVGADFPKLVDLRMVEGTFFTPLDEQQGKPVCVVSERLARQFFGKASPLGKTLRMGGFDGLAPPGMQLPPEKAGQDVRIIGVFEPPDRRTLRALQGPGVGIGFPGVDLLTPLSRPGSATGGAFQSIVIRAKEGRAEAARREIETILKGRHPGADLTVRSGAEDDPFGPPTDFMDSQTKFYGLMGLVALFVAGIGILSAMLVAVLERTREVVLRRAMGATRRGVLLQFLAEAGLTGFLGGALGLLIGAAGARWLSDAMMPFFVRVMGLDRVFNPTAALIALAMGVLVGLLGGVYPALQASRLAPAEALREG